MLGWVEPQPSPLKTVIEIWPTANAWSPEAAEQLSNQLAAPPTLAAPDAKTRRYWIDPRELLNAQKYARDQTDRILDHRDGSRHFDIIGIYHSHPDHPAQPSECDRACAWAEYSYIIVSVQQGHAQDLLCWKLNDRHQFEAEAIVVEPGSTSAPS